MEEGSKRESKESGTNSGFGSGVWSWKEILGVFVSGEPAVLAGEGSSLMVEWSRPTEIALLQTLQHLRQHYHLFGGGVVAARSDETGQWTTQEGQTEPISSSLQSPQKDERDNRAGTGGECTSYSVAEGDSCTIGRVLHSLSKMALSFHFTDANAFIYGLTPSTVSTMSLAYMM